MKQEFALSHIVAAVLKTSERAELKHPNGLLDKYLHLRVRVGAGVINTLLEDMSKFLYTEADQQDIEGENEGDLRYPELGTLKIKHKMVGAKFTIHYGIGGSDMVFDGSQVDSFAVEAMQGGTFVLDFRVWIKPQFDDLPNLGRILGREAEISVEPAKEQQQSLPMDGNAPAAAVADGMPGWSHWETRIKALMQDMGMPNSHSAYQALSQLANEMGQAHAASVAPHPSSNPGPLAAVEPSDTARLDWLEAHFVEVVGVYLSGESIVTVSVDCEEDCIADGVKNRIRAALDAAIAASKEGASHG